MTFLLFLLLFFCFPVEAEVFWWTDTNGQTHFSDKQHPGSQHLSINAGYSYYTIKKVYDGDTVLLSNGDKVRFLGINTPEVAHHNKQAQAGGEQAKQWLIQQLKNKKVRLETDIEKKDKYGRLLAHVITENNEHVNLLLIQKGWATLSIYPPNLRYSKVFAEAQKQAQKNRLGIWQYPEYAVQSASQITGTKIKGWQRINGRVNTIRHSRKYSYLNLTDHFGLKIARKSEHLFPPLENYMGKLVEARGWVRRHKNSYSLLIRHPSALLVLD